MFGRNRESRSRDAAGRRNWPEAVPRKMSGRKRRWSHSAGTGLTGRRQEKDVGGVMSGGATRGKSNDNQRLITTGSSLSRGHAGVRNKVCMRQLF